MDKMHHLKFVEVEIGFGQDLAGSDLNKFNKKCNLSNTSFAIKHKSLIMIWKYLIVDVFL